ncbi:MAG: hypothetical protein U0703_06230 [Anaerolineae bacterium]
MIDEMVMALIGRRSLLGTTSQAVQRALDRVRRVCQRNRPGTDVADRRLVGGVGSP